MRQLTIARKRKTARRLQFFFFFEERVAEDEQ